MTSKFLKFRSLFSVLAMQCKFYAPVDNMVSDWRARGLLNVACPTVCGFVENGGQLDLRGMDDPILGEIPATDTLRSAHTEREVRGLRVSDDADCRSYAINDFKGLKIPSRRMASNIWAGPRWADKIHEAMNSHPA